MRLAKLYLAAAAVLTGTMHSAIGADAPKIGGVVNYVASSGTVLVNGIPVTSFKVDVYGSGGSGMDITDWLSNGSNLIKLVVKPVDDQGRATLELQNFTSGEALLTLTQEGAGETSATIDVAGIPEWAWFKATPVTAAPEGLAETVGKLHTAYANSDIEQIVTISAPFFADQERLDGMSAAMFSSRIAPMLKAGTLAPLPQTAITSHANGRLFRVIADDGYPPIRVSLDADGTKQTMRTGEWWSMIDGVWRVVR